MKQNFIEDNIIILSKQTIDKILKQKNPSDLIGLYCFYYYTAKWQKTNIIKCTTGYVSKGLNWTKERVINTKKELKSMGLIEDKQTKNDKGQIIGWYIKVNYIWKKETIKSQRVVEPESGFTQRVDKQDTNALSANKLNALNTNNKKGNTSVNHLIDLFKEINPSYKKIYSNTTQRKALENLVKEHGEEDIKKILQFLPTILKEKYAPVITTPVELENKLGKLQAYIQKNGYKKSDVSIAVL
jgi:hypothetical protein